MPFCLPFPSCGRPAVAADDRRMTCPNGPMLATIVQRLAARGGGPGRGADLRALIGTRFSLRHFFAP